MQYLSNTFGEFLTSDFLLRYAFQETEALHMLKQSESLRAELQRKIQNPDGLVKEWFACLMYAPLYSRPVVLEMLREWTGHLLQRKRRSREDFLGCLDEILRSQIAMILNGRNLPLMMRTDDAARFSLNVARTKPQSPCELHKIRLTRHQVSARACRSSSL